MAEVYEVNLLIDRREAEHPAQRRAGTVGAPPGRRPSCRVSPMARLAPEPCSHPVYEEWHPQRFGPRSGQWAGRRDAILLSRSSMRERIRSRPWEALGSGQQGQAARPRVGVLARGIVALARALNAIALVIRTLQPRRMREGIVERLGELFISETHPASKSAATTALQKHRGAVESGKLEPRCSWSQNLHAAVPEESHPVWRPLTLECFTSTRGPCPFNLHEARRCKWRNRRETLFLASGRPRSLQSPLVEAATVRTSGPGTRDGRAGSCTSRGERRPAAKGF